MKQSALVLILAITIGIVIELLGRSGQCAEPERMIIVPGTAADVKIKILPSKGTLTSELVASFR
jgi:hypothetical protein